MTFSMRVDSYSHIQQFQWKCYFIVLLNFDVEQLLSVSGVHARLEKRDGQLLITDLDSTNGTFINDKRIRPGAVTSVPPGSYITFGIFAYSSSMLFVLGKNLHTLI